jgi:hypothetical protein
LQAPGDIAGALARHPKAYSLSLGHMQDLTLRSFAYLRWPLALAAGAFLIGAVGTTLGARARANKARSEWSPQRAIIAAAVMMVLFFQAARLALVAFDPYMSSRPLAHALESSPAGTLIVDRHYYRFSSMFFYTNRTALLLNGRYQNLEYGAYAPRAPQVFVDDSQISWLWRQPERYYVVAYESELPRFERLAGDSGVFMVRRSGGKMLLTNHPLGLRMQPEQLAQPTL